MNRPLHLAAATALVLMAGGPHAQQVTPTLVTLVPTNHPRVPRDLQAIVLKCLEKDRTRRYATAAELAEDLSRWQRGEAVLAQPPSLVTSSCRLARAISPGQDFAPAKKS